MIDAGLPDDRDGWPGSTLEDLRQFVQGDIVGAPPIFYFADPASAVFAATQEAELDEPDVVVIDGAAPKAIITSQTCDIAEEDSARPSKPFVSVSPVYDAQELLDGSSRSLLRKNRGPAYLIHLPELEDGFWVADLRIEVPVEKGWLAQQAPTRAFATEEAQLEVGARLARLRSRPAFAGSFVEALHRPLVDALKALKSTDKERWARLLSNVTEVRAAVDNRLEPTTAQIYVLNDTRIPGDVQDWFRTWWDEANQRASTAGIALQALRVETYAELSAHEYRASGELDLTRVSPM